VSHYDSYAAFKNYSTPEIGSKHIRRFDREVWEPAGFEVGHSVLEIGCGTGLFMAYLAAKGITNLVGIDRDPALADVVPEPVRGRFHVADAPIFVKDACARGETYDRIALFDVLEHFDGDEGRALLAGMGEILAPDGRIVIKVPNAASPWGQQFQYGDLTHKTAYTPESLAQQAIAAGFVCLSAWPHLLGSPARRTWEGMLHAVLDKVLTSPPPIWQGNFYGLLAKAAERP
jgi:cyclopropane fatty-acyl-phospholipid synthase-like methyltransferase